MKHILLYLTFLALDAALFFGWHLFLAWLLFKMLPYMDTWGAWVVYWMVVVGTYVRLFFFMLPDCVKLSRACQQVYKTRCGFLS